MSVEITAFLSPNPKLFVGLRDGNQPGDVEGR
jgi:hypothetical protein